MLDASTVRSVAALRGDDDVAAASAAISLESVRVPRRRVRLAAWRQLLRQQSLRWFAVLASLELVLLSLAPWLAVETRFLGDAHSLALARDALPLQGLVFAVVVWTTMIALGLYQRHRRDIKGNAPGTIARVGLAMLVGGVALMVLYFLLPPTEVGRGVLALSLMYGLLLLLLSRASFWRLVGDARLKLRTLFLGAGHNASLVLGRMRREQDMRSSTVVGFVPMAGEAIDVPADRVLDVSGDLVRYAYAQGVDEIVIAADDRRGALPMADLMTCRLSGIDVLELESFYERETGKVTLELVNPSWFVFARVCTGSIMRRAVKRGFDLAAAFVLLLVSWPFMLLTAAAILIESRGHGPVLYRQQRVGENDALFTLIKFRSMRTDAEVAGARWAQLNDDRVTRVGRFIRKVRLDELPQLWNVLRGEMSIVGPRPERPEFVEGFKQRIPYYGLRHCVAPGLTGWAQLRYPYGASEADAIEKLRYDLYYVKNHGFQFDLMVLLQTVEVVLFGRGGR